MQYIVALSQFDGVYISSMVIGDGKTHQGIDSFLKETAIVEDMWVDILPNAPTPLRINDYSVTHDYLPICLS